MPRRPDPETGLLEVLPTSTPPMRTLAAAMPDAYEGQMLAYLDTLPSRAARNNIVSSPLAYPIPTPAPERPMSVVVGVDRDFASQGVRLNVRAYSPNTGGTAVIESITWRTVAPGEDLGPSTTFFVEERAARMLAEELGDLNPEVRRAARTREQLDQSQNELRSLHNQLEEVRNHNTTLDRVNQEAQRQIRWLERELRDANQERRADLEAAPSDA